MGGQGGGANSQTVGQVIEDDFISSPGQPGSIWGILTRLQKQAYVGLDKSAGDWLKIMEKRLLTRVAAKNDNYTALAVFIN